MASGLWELRNGWTTRGDTFSFKQSLLIFISHSSVEHCSRTSVLFPLISATALQLFQWGCLTRVLYETFCIGKGFYMRPFVYRGRFLYKVVLLIYRVKPPGFQSSNVTYVYSINLKVLFACSIFFILSNPACYRPPTKFDHLRTLYTKGRI